MFQQSGLPPLNNNHLTSFLHRFSSFQTNSPQHHHLLQQLLPPIPSSSPFSYNPRLLLLPSNSPSLSSPFLLLLLQCVGYLKELSELDMRNLSKVTSAGFSSIASGCMKLAELDMKNCENITHSGFFCSTYHSKNLKQVWCLTFMLKISSKFSNIKYIILLLVKCSTMIK